MDTPIPGRTIVERVKSNPRVWHFAFHNARDVAEMLVDGRALGLLFYFLAVVFVFIASPGIYVEILLVYLVNTIALFVINATPFETAVRARKFSWDLPLQVIAGPEW